MSFDVKGFDLHMHSTHSSDGVLFPQQILTALRSKGLNLLSITDHNTLGACADMKLFQGRYGSETLYINGTELSAYHGDREIHVLAYGFDADDPVMADIIRTFLANRDMQTRKRTEKLAEMGFTIDYNELMQASGGKTASGVTFLKVLASHEENRENLQDYLTGEKSASPYTNFYFDYFVKGGKAWVDVRLLDFFDVVNKLKDRAFLSIAHPALYKDRRIEELLVDGIRGIEAFSTYHDAEKISYYIDAAKKNKMILTAGSDFHGERIKPGIRIGGHGCLDAELIKPFVTAVTETDRGWFLI